MSASERRTSLRWLGGGALILAGFLLGLIVSSGGAGNDTGVAVGPASAAAPVPAVEGAHGSYADVAARVMPAVVNISTDKVVKMPDMHPFFDDPLFRRFFGEPRGQERERIEKALGSGVIVSPDGYILTSNHVVSKASKVRVLRGENEEYEAEIVGQDEKSDVALIKIDAEDLPYLELGDSSALRIGDEVLAVGNPFGVGQTVTHGIVSALGRSIGLIDYEDFIQTDAAINPGNSGGALVNMRGELVGINTAIVSRSGGSQGIGFAIPSNMARRIMEMLKEHGKVQRAWLGVLVQPVDKAMADALGLDSVQGVLVSSVEDDTPAQEAGVQEGDIILKVDGKPVNSVSRLRNIISLAGVGTKVKLDILRDGKRITKTVKLGELPDDTAGGEEDTGEGKSSENLQGVKVRNLTDALRQRLDIPDDVEGVVVVDVDRTSNAFDRGLREGDVITEVWREPVKNVRDYKRLLKKNPDRPVLLKLRRGDRSLLMAIPR